MGDRSFYLYPRKSGIYYAELLDQEGSRVICRSTRSKNRDEAASIVGRWLTEGVPNKSRVKPVKNTADFKTVMCFLKTGDINEDEALEIVQALKSRGLLSIGVSPGTQGKKAFIQFLLDFWDPEKSIFLKDRAAHGKPVTARYCAEVRQIIKRDCRLYFNDLALGEITRKMLKEFGISLKNQGLTGGTINNRLAAITQPLRWAYHEKMIPENISEKLGGYKGGERKRDILTRDEFKALFSVVWADKRAYAGALLAATSGLRIGEVQGLRRENVGEGILYITNNWNPIDRLKKPKNGEERTVYLLPEVQKLLMELLAESPWAGMQNPFVFYSEYSDEKPYRDVAFRHGLYRAMELAEISRDGRKLDFHSLRHTAGTMLLDATGDLRKTGKILGHRDLKMTAHYGDHENKEVIAEMGKTAANVLSFPIAKEA